MFWYLSNNISRRPIMFSMYTAYCKLFLPEESISLLLKFFSGIIFHSPKKFALWSTQVYTPASQHVLCFLITKHQCVSTGTLPSSLSILILSVLHFLLLISITCTYLSAGICLFFESIKHWP